MSYYKGISEIPLYKQSIDSNGVISQVLDWEPNKIANLLDLQYDESKNLFYKNDNTMGIYVKPDYQQNTLIIRFYFNNAVTNMSLINPLTITLSNINQKWALGYAKSPTRKGLMLGFYPNFGANAFGPILSTFIVTFKNVNTQEEKIGYIFPSEFTASTTAGDDWKSGIILEQEKNFTTYTTNRHSRNQMNSSQKILSLAPITYKDFYAEETYNFSYANNYPQLFDTTRRSILLISSSNKKFLTSSNPRVIFENNENGLVMDRYAVMEVDV